MVIFSSAVDSRRRFVELSREDLIEIDIFTIKQMRDAGCDEDCIRSVIGDNYEELVEEEKDVQWVEPKHGETRVVRKFLWLPRTFNRITKWLEMASIKEEYEAYGHYIGQWREVGFAEA